MNICSLRLHRNSCQTGKINYCQIRYTRWVYVQNDSLINNVLILATNFISKLFYWGFDFGKIGKFLVWYLVKTSIRLFQALNINHSYLQWPSGNNTLWIRKKCTDPRGKISRPTTCSMRELLPELCDPTATIFGNFIYS